MRCQRTSPATAGEETRFLQLAPQHRFDLDANARPSYDPSHPTGIGARPQADSSHTMALDPRNAHSYRLSTPTVSVAMCTYNGAPYLPQQLESIAAQESLPDEMVVCDDGSTDATCEILREFASRAPFPVRMETNPRNLGSTQNFGKAVGLCRGELIFLADQDDVWMPHKIRRLSETLCGSSTIAFAFSDAQLIDRQGQPSAHRLWATLPFPPSAQAQFNAGGEFDLLLRRNVVTGTTMAFRAAYRDVLLPIVSGWVHDGWFALLLAAMGSGRAVAEPLVHYRQHGGQQIGARPETLFDKYRRRKRQGPGFYGTTAENYSAALQRLQSAAERLPDRFVLEALRRKIEHWQTRARMRGHSIWRLPWILRELLRGSYGRYSAGWRSAIEDVLL